MPMKGLICYYSGTGNTKLASRYIANHAEVFAFDLVDVTKVMHIDWAQYAIVGFATFTDFWNPPHLFERFIAEIPPQTDKPAFVFNTYGLISGRTLLALEKQVSRRGFLVLGGHSLHTPENYPPMIVSGNANADAPSDQELQAFRDFVAQVENWCAQIAAAERVSRGPVRAGLLNSLFPRVPRSIARRSMGEKHIDAELCTTCGLCARMCPYDAITMAPQPVFDKQKCYSCWRCFNLCPQKAIYTRNYRDVGHYPAPLAALKSKLSE